MTEYLMQFALGNGAVSALVALSAWLAQTRLRRPMLAHLLWLLALAKLVTPPLLTIPLLPAPGGDPAAVSPTTGAVATITEAPAGTIAPGAVEAAAGWLPPLGEAALWLWLAGSVVVLLCSAARIARFHHLLSLSSRPAPDALQQLADRLAPTLGLRRAPRVRVTTARVSPMVWWLGGRVRVFVPAEMQAELGRDQLRWILAHELGHVRRGDHLVRWLEWLACVGFWWNPVAWWARRNLRANEEICCDALVLRTFGGGARSYANSLLRAVEFLASPGLRPPALASEINSGGFLERRFRMIVSKTPPTSTPRWLQAALLLFTTAVLPLGIAYAQNPDVDAVGKRLRTAVREGELSKQQARTMLDALRKNAGEPRGSEAVGKKLRAMVQAGEISKQQARAMHDAWRKAQTEYVRLQRDTERQLDEARAQEEAAVREGRVDLEEARRIYSEQAATAKHKLDRAQAVYAERLRDQYRQLGQNPLRVPREKALSAERREQLAKRYQAAAEKLERAVAEGKVDAKEAKKKLESARRTLEYAHDARAEARDRKEARRREKNDDRRPIGERARSLRVKLGAERRERPAAAQARHDAATDLSPAEKTKRASAHLKQLVELGVLSKEQARAQLDAFASRAGTNSKRRKATIR